MPVTVIRCGHFFLPVGREAVIAWAARTVARAKRARTGVEQQERQEQSATPEQFADDGYRAALAARDTRIAELEKQVAEAAESKAAAKKLADEIEKARAEAAEERVAYELRLAGVFNVKAAKVPPADYEGDVGKLREGKL